MQTNPSSDQPAAPAKPPIFGRGALIVSLLIGFAAVFTLGVVAVGRADSGGGTAAAGARSTVPVALADYKILPGEITVAEGGTLEVTNKGAMPHNLVVEGKNLSTPMLDGGNSASLQLQGLAPGTYTVYCAVPGHRQLGMEAKLTVAATADGTASPTGNMAGMAGMGPAAAGGAATPTTMTSNQMDEAMAKSIKAFPAKTQGTGGQLLAPKILPDGTKEFDLTAKVTKWEVAPGKLVDAMTYNGVVPGPTIKVNPGDKVAIVLHNQLPESTAVHFHGIEVPNAMDGVPYVTQDPIKPGQTYTYRFTAQSTPAVGMYHSHDNATRQVPDGMLGPFLVGEEPVPAGTQVAQEQSMVLNDSGVIGLTLNGKSFPATAPTVAKLGDWIEVHYMNEGQQAHPMHLHGLPQLVIAKDGFPLPPYAADTINVAPGERYTVLIHADQPGTWVWHCHILSHAENDNGMFGMVTAVVVK